MDLKTIGYRLKIIMAMKCIKRREVAKKIGVSYNTLTKKLNGKRDFSFTEIILLKEILTIDTEVYAKVLFDTDFKII